MVCAASLRPWRANVPSRPVEIDVATPAGIRHCSVRATDHPQTVVATVDMGSVTAGPTPDVDDLMGAVSEELQNSQVRSRLT